MTRPKTITVKICGLTTPESVAVACETGATYTGFVFYPKSPRHITGEQAAELADLIPVSIIKVGVFVNPDNDRLDDILGQVALDLIQLHGSETPERVQEIKSRFNRPVMKAIAVAGPDDMALAKKYDTSADMLLFDAPPSLTNALPGGNGLSFDWHLIRETDWKIPWMLSGGLDIGNVAQAISLSGAKIVDVSSGLENRPGEKSILKIKDFINRVNMI